MPTELREVTERPDPPCPTKRRPVRPVPQSGRYTGMPQSARLGLALVALLAAAPVVRAQNPVSDRPEPFTPARPETRDELNRCEALKQYGLGVFYEHDNRLLAAVRAYEEAARLDPDAAPPLKALVTLYLG